MAALGQAFFATDIQTNFDSFLGQFPCSKRGKLNKCKSSDLASSQLLSQNITKNQVDASTFATQDSIVQLNSTFHGVPEISYFNEMVFLPSLPETERANYQGANVLFTNEMAALFFDYTSSINPLVVDQPKKVPTTILNAYNIRTILTAGATFSVTKDLGAFKGIKEQYGLVSNEQARLLFSWLAYLG